MGTYTLEVFLDMECPGGPDRKGRQLEVYEAVLADSLKFARFHGSTEPKSFNTALLHVDHQKDTVEMVCDIYPQMEFKMPIEDFVDKIKRYLCGTL
ncbi:MAG: hypothetical protein JW722_09125 [Demequinaceae bacterium]|nr:hypothetical protein [Demequinaceae bacterium]